MEYLEYKIKICNIRDKHCEQRGRSRIVFEINFFILQTFFIARINIYVRVSLRINYRINHEDLNCCIIFIIDLLPILLRYHP